MSGGDPIQPSRDGLGVGGRCAARAVLHDGSGLVSALYSVVVEPPAAAIFCVALPENACTLTWTATEIDPVPSTLTGRPLRTAPLATRSSTVTSPPSGYSTASLSRLTTWYSTRNGLRKPLSFGTRMCSGIWPPSKDAGTWVRALLPLVPRPADLPLDPSPRPTRALRVWAPGAGRR